MLDPFTCIGLASAIVQFTDCAVKIVSHTKEIYKSADGSLIKHDELRVQTTDIRKLCDNITQTQSPLPGAPGDEAALLELSRTCQNVADELLAVLEDLKAHGKREKWESFKKALKSSSRVSKIECINTRLDRITSQLHFRLTSIVR